MTRSPAWATAVALTWTLMLAGLSLLWIRSPFLGPGHAFTLWSVPAAVATVATWWWVRRQSIPQIPRSTSLVTLIAFTWLLMIVIAWSDIGALLALDGAILRRDGVIMAGRVLHWLPLAFGGALSVAGLAAGLEARYRLVNAPGTPARPPDPAR